MRRDRKPTTCKHARQPRSGSRGVALIATLLLLTLMVAMTLAMTISVTSDALINRYYRNYRASFYAADSGVNVARQYMLNQLQTQAINVGTTYSSSAVPPLVATDASTALSNTLTQYGSATSVNAGGAASSWPGSYQIVSSQAGTLGTTLSSTPTCTVGFTPPSSGTMNTPAAGGYTCVAGNVPQCTGTCTGFTATFAYIYPYQITAIGQSLASEQQIVEDAGNMVLNVNIGTSTAYTQSFAGWGMFIDQYPECNGNDLVKGTITGPVFTNGAWTFGNSGSYTFTGKVGSVSSTFGFDFGGGTCIPSGTSSYKSGSQTIAPTFQGGYTLGAHNVALPTNTFNQKEAVVDGKGNTGSINNTQMNASLKTVTGTPYPSGGTTAAGVYLPYSTSSTTCGGALKTPCMTGGGVYVESDAKNITLTASNPSNGPNSGHAMQVIAITQGSTTTTVTLDLTAQTTTVVSGSSSQVIHGIPENLSGSSPSPATMLYVDGNIGTSSTTGLSGPGQGVAGIENGEAMTVTANGNINITGDLLYQAEPVTFTQNQIPGTPVDTLIPGNDHGQVLGLFTATGNVNLYNQQSSNNLEIDASIATISSGGSGGIVNPGNAISALTIVGGRIQNTIQNINSTTRNVYFDQRFGTAGFAPPWFPSTIVTPTGSDTVTSVNSTVTRTQWLSVY